VQELILYSRENCHLCDEMVSELEDLLKGSDNRYHVIKVNGDPELEQRYGARVPVLVGGNRELCYARLDREKVKSYLNGSP